MIRMVLSAAILVVFLVANASALSWPPQVEADCEPRWTAENGEEEIIWAAQMRSCAFCLAEQPACQFSAEPLQKPGTDIPEFSGIAAGLAISGAGVAYLVLNRRK